MPGAEYLEAILLGVIQGITEFLPVSSSSHLMICSELIHSGNGKKFDSESSSQMTVALHLGTLFSILVVYRKDLLPAFRNVRLVGAILLTTLPLVVVALFAKDFIDKELQTSLVAGCGLLVTAGFLAISQRASSGEKTAETLGWWSVLLVGLSQAMAIIPGISRSGSTISSGLLCGLRKEEAARFSFMIAVPAIAGAVILKTRDMLKGEGGAHSLDVLFVGILVSFLVGVVTLRGLIRLVTNSKLYWFAWYCAAVGSATIIWQLIKIYG